MLRVGILYPRSSIYPLLGADFVDGIKSSLAFHHGPEELQLITESAGFGAVEKEVYSKTEQLLLDERADIVIAFLDMKVIPVLQPLLTATDKLFIVVNPGANYPENWIPPPGTLYLSLLDGFLCRLTGMLASREGSTKALLAASFYDGGYQHSQSMVNAFAANGGHIQYNYISPQKINEFNISGIGKFLEKEPDAGSMLCLFSGEEANLFYEKVNGIPGADNLSLYVSPMMLEEQNCLKLRQEPVFASRGYIPWHSSLGHEENRAFQKTILEQTKRQANIFSLLGWETGILIRQGLNKGIQSTTAGKIAEQFYKEKISSPRGLLQTDPATNYIIGPVHKAGLKKDKSISILETVSDPAEEWSAFVKEEPVQTRSGWLNTYLCY